ncbi:MAG: ribosome biogenesis GTPase Der [Deltaproteobacteria bacterium]|nr:ribosome biogenesis GTPase Der [Deltaproteobacteria bacterium]
MSAERSVVALIGRPNVGKSTLFNRMVGRQQAIVHDRPGVTRDRHYGDTEIRGRSYTLIDTGGFEPQGDDDMQQGIAAQVEVAIAEADVTICVLDSRTPPTSADSEELALLRRSEKPVIYVGNKADSERLEVEGNELYRLGVDHIFFVSALHGRGMPALEEALAEALGDPPEPVSDDDSEEDEAAEREEIRVAVVGRPNAGKSSLINRLLGEERLLVDSRPGTTRDAIDSFIEKDGRRYLFVDTAGLRRKASVARGRDAVEAMSVMVAVKAIQRAEVVVLLCDADVGVAEQDAKVLGLAMDRGRGIVIALNKMDLLDRDGKKEAESKARDVLSFVPWAKVTRLSAKTGRGVKRLLDAINGVRRSFDRRVSTGELNRFFDDVLAAHPPPIHRGRAPRFYYVTQARIRPPTFMVVTSHPNNLHFSYQRYVVNAIRKEFDFEGVPIRLHYRRKDRRERKGKRR